MSVAANLPWAVGLNIAAAWTGYRIATVSRSGAIGGAVIGATIYAAAGLAAWLMLMATFGAAVLASRFRLREKLRLGVAQEMSGRRGAASAAANCGAAAFAAIAIATMSEPRQAFIAFVAALVAAGSDTVASEIGKSCGGSPFLVTSFKRVSPGTPGAMSVAGTMAGFLAACGLSGVALLLGLIPAVGVLPIVAGATAGALAESILASTLETRGLLNNDALNLINTLVAVAITLELA